MNIKYLLPLLLLGAASCSTDEEPIEVNVPQPPVQEMQVDMKAFKSTIAERQATIGMFYGWGNLNKNSLTALPDSMDIVVLKDNYSHPSDLMLDDLHKVQTQEYIKVLPSLDIQVAAKSAKRTMADKIKKAKKEAEKAGIEWNSELKKEVEDGVKAQFLEQIQKEAQQVLEAVHQYAYDGIAVKLPYDFDMISEENLKAILEQYAAIAGKEQSSALFIIENPVKSQILEEQIAAANYIVASKPDEGKIATFDNEAKLWPAANYCPSFNMADAKLQEGFSDYVFFDENGSLAKDLYLIKWNAPNKKGIAIYHIEKMYFQLAEINGYVLPYVELRQMINRVNAQN